VANIHARSKQPAIGPKKFANGFDRICKTISVRKTLRTAQYNAESHAAAKVILVPCIRKRGFRKSLFLKSGFPMARTLARKAITENANNSLAIKGDMPELFMSYARSLYPQSPKMQ
jgi:hypothetical protein